MESSANKSSNNSVARRSTPASVAKCLSCGTDIKKPRRRYCSDKCRQQINWVLALSKGLLRALNARYAAFSFTRGYVVLDVLPAWADNISRLIYARTSGNNPAEDLKNLVLQYGMEWHYMVDNNSSRSFASLSLINKNHKKDLDPDGIRPNRKIRPKLSKHEDICLKALRLNRKDLSSDGHTTKIKSAYKRMAKIYHPDMGGDTEKFKQLNEAHEKMLQWAENPMYTSRRALQDCWSYDSNTNRWSPPL
ncbi:MAG: DnaJ domain-containing protein [Desulfobacterales bacterium]|nr:DnaJ domain-containing protein [Desulfobacterales bacterium]